MFCKHCGKLIKLDDKFCPYCGGKVQETETPELKLAEEPKEEIKTYSSIFWKYFGLLFLINIVSTIMTTIEEEGKINLGLLWVIFLIAIVVCIYFFCKVINEAMLSIGKKNWWPLGLLALIPFGFWITFFVVRAQLKPRGKWSIKGEKISLVVIVGIVIGVIAIIGMLAGIVLVSMGSARMRARDARRISDVRQVATALEIYVNDNQLYPATYNWSELERMLSPYLSPLPIDPLNKNPCVYSYSSYNGTSYKITYCSESEGKIIKEMKEELNLIFCNDKYWSPCPIDKKFHCPKKGDPFCCREDLICNDKCWGPCPTGRIFYCPPEGDPYCY